jgi:Ca-activated chloride channel homolog
MSKANKVATTFGVIAARCLGHVRLSLFLILITLLLEAAPQLAQGQPTDDVVRVDTSLVQLNVGVVDRRGQSITDLSRDNFTIYEDGKRQTVASFEATAAPFSLALLLDLSGSTLGFRQQIKQAALRFTEALQPDDRVTVIAFNEKTVALTKFTSDRNKIAWAITNAEGKGGTELYAALRFALKELAGEGKRRKAIVVLTDGLDTGMRNVDRKATADANTNEEAMAAIKPEASGPLSAVLNDADRQGVTIYPLALPSGDPKRLPLPTPQLIGIYSAARARIQILADRTGGRLSDIRRLEDLYRLYGEVAADLRTLYTIAYQPSGARPRDGRWRTIRIEVNRPDLIARTRPGYYAN